MKKLISFLVIALLLSAVLPVRAQRFSVTVDTVALNIIDNGHPWASTEIETAVKYHDHYFLLLHVYDGYRTFDTVVTVSIDGKEVKSAGIHLQYGDWQHGHLFVRNDTLYRINDNYLNPPSGYFFDEKSWSWIYQPYIDEIVYEDEDFVVRKEHIYGKSYWKSICFTEKRERFYMETKNGWLQMEPFHRRYILRDPPERIVRLDDTYYFIYHNRVGTVNVQERPGLELRKTAFPDIVLGDKADVHQWHNGYYTLNDTDDVKLSFHLHKEMKSVAQLHDAFCINDQMYYVISSSQGTSIMQYVDNQLEEVLSFGDFVPSSLNSYISYLNRHIAGNQCFAILFSGPSTYGVMAVNDTGIHIRYFTK